jgi:hypothetical protein
LFKIEQAMGGTTLLEVTGIPAPVMVDTIAQKYILHHHGRHRDAPRRR